MDDIQKKHFLLFLTIIFACWWNSCSHLPPVPLPDKLFIDQIRQNPQEVLSETDQKNPVRFWANTYFLAQKASQQKQDIKACRLYEKLLLDKTFPIKVLIRLNMLKSCFHSQAQLLDFAQEELEKPIGWAYHEYVKIMLQQSQKFHLPDLETNFLLESIAFKKFQKDKLKTLNKATQMADQFNLEEKKKIILQQKIQIAPRFLDDPKTKNDLLLAAKDHQRVRNFNKSRKLYKLILDKKNPTNKEKIKIFNSIRMSYKLERNKAQYLKHTKSLVHFLDKLSKKSSRYIRVLQKYKIILARIYWTLDDFYNSKKILTNLLKSNNKLSNANTSLTYKLLGLMELENKNFESAQKNMEKSLSINHIPKNEKYELLWSLFLNSYLHQNYEAALNYLNEIDNNNPKNYWPIKTKFWKGRISLLKGNRKKSVENLSKVMNQDKYGYYGIMASYLLKIKFKPYTNSNHHQRARLPIYEWLRAFNETELASRYLSSKFYKLTGHEDMLSYFPLLYESKEIDQIIWSFYKIPMKKRNIILDDYLPYVFPFPYLETANKYAKRYNVPVELVYAIMRQESSFNTNARSPADAFGLMQIIPSKATEMAELLNIKLADQDDLYDPQINIPIGTYLLGHLYNSANQQLIYVSASYNAGDKAVANWLKNRFQADPLIFIENIPYKETRNYVKLIIRNFINYKRLLSGEEFLFPESIIGDMEKIRDLKVKQKKSKNKLAEIIIRETFEKLL